MASRSDSSRLLAVGILKFPSVLMLSIQSVGIERSDLPRDVMYTDGHYALFHCWICDTLGMRNQGRLWQFCRPRLKSKMLPLSPNQKVINKKAKLFT
ncbi:hypothetical protein TNCV_328001 [Trichonephila clavipes]|nr:hypothetical protein TNCV_328001 [Trichonephila clavipes]